MPLLSPALQHSSLPCTAPAVGLYQAAPGGEAPAQRLPVQGSLQHHRAEVWVCQPLCLGRSCREPLGAGGQGPISGHAGGWWGIWSAGGESVLGSPGTGSVEDTPELPRASATKFSCCHAKAEIWYRRLAVIEGKSAELPSQAGTHQEQSQRQLQLCSATPEHLHPAGWG